MSSKQIIMSPERYNYLRKKLREDINFLFVTQEIVGHAFADFRGTAGQLSIETSEFTAQVNNMTECLQWFSAWYQEAFANNPEKIESIGQTGDELKNRLREIYTRG